MLNQTMGAAERKDFGKKWIKDNADLLVYQLGPRNQGGRRVRRGHQESRGQDGTARAVVSLIT